MKWLEKYYNDFRIDDLISEICKIAKNTYEIDYNLEEQRNKALKTAIYLIIKYKIKSIYELSVDDWKEFISKTRKLSKKETNITSIKLFHNSLWELNILNQRYSRNFYELDNEKNRFSNVSEKYQILFNSFIETAKKTKEKETIYGYYQSLEKFYQFIINKYNKNFKLAKLKISDLHDYVKKINKTKKESGELYSRSWMENMIFSLKTFIKFLINNKKEFKNKGISIPDHNILIDDLFKITRKNNFLPRPIEEKELNLLIEALNKMNNRIYILSFTLMLFTGLSKSDLINLKRDCLKEEGNDRYFLNYYRNKTKSHEKIFVTKEVAIIIDKIKKLNTQNKKTKHPDGTYCYYLINSAGQKKYSKWFDYWFNKHKKIAQEENKDNYKLENITIHMLRHSYASKLRDLGYDIVTIKELLSQKNINTTKVYTKESDEKKMEVMKKFHKDIFSNNLRKTNSTKNVSKKLIDKNDFAFGSCKIEEENNCNDAYKCVDCEYLYSTPGEIMEMNLLIKKQLVLYKVYKTKLKNIKNKDKKELVKNNIKTIKKRIMVLKNKVNKLNELKTKTNKSA